MVYNFVISYQSYKKNNKADALICKLNKRPIDNNDKRLEYQIKTLLPPEHFEHVVNLQPIEVKNKNSLRAQTPNYHITSEEKDHKKLHANPQSPTTSAKYRLSVSKFLTLPEKVKYANQTDDLCTQICAYLKVLSKNTSIIQLDSCRINDGLLIIKNCL